MVGSSEKSLYLYVLYFLSGIPVGGDESSLSASFSNIPIKEAHCFVSESVVSQGKTRTAERSSQRTLGVFVSQARRKLVKT